MKTATSPPHPHPVARKHLPHPPIIEMNSPSSSGKFLSETLQHHWPFFKAVFKEQYMVLTDDDLAYTAGHEDEFLEHLERITCRPRDEFERLIATQAFPSG